MSEQDQKNVFIPLVLLAAALVIWFVFQASQLFHERTRLTDMRTIQETAFQNAQKMRRQLDALAAGTQKLANGGNKNAQSLVNALAQRGITINPEGEKKAPAQ